MFLLMTHSLFDVLTRSLVRCWVNGKCSTRTSWFETTWYRRPSGMRNSEPFIVDSRMNWIRLCRPVSERVSHKLLRRQLKYRGGWLPSNARTLCCWPASPSSTPWVTRTIAELHLHPVIGLLPLPDNTKHMTTWLSVDSMTWLKECLQVVMSGKASHPVLYLFHAAIPRLPVKRWHYSVTSGRTPKARDGLDLIRTTIAFSGPPRCTASVWRTAHIRYYSIPETCVLPAIRLRDTLVLSITRPQRQSCSFTSDGQ